MNFTMNEVKFTNTYISNVIAKNNHNLFFETKLKQYSHETKSKLSKN